MNVPSGDAPIDAWIVPDRLDLTFEGFTSEAFALLERLRREPHVEQYRKEKEGVRRYLTEPFKRFRDDLVVNGVLPNRVDFETEKNVFSRLLKNDFGAGGCHHHLWMAFYRPGRRRLKDVQLAPCITPDGFTMGLFVGAYMKELLRQAKRNIAASPGRFLEVINPLLQSRTLSYYEGTGARKQRGVHTQPLTSVPEALFRAEGIWLRGSLPRHAVVAMRSDLVGWTLEEFGALWPLYRFILTEEMRIIY